MTQLYDSIYPYLRDIGATAVIFALLLFAVQQSRMQHERSMARDKDLAETTRMLINSLIDCLNCKD